jgi:signal peptidase II
MIGTASRLTTRVVLVLAVLGTIGCDRVTKHLAASALAGTAGRSYLGDTVWLGYVENRGGFLSVGANLSPGVQTLIFTGGTGLMLVALTMVAIRQRWRGWPATGLALFVAGGASNWIDRAVRGSVVDFMNVGIGPVRTGVFNVADMAIMLGAAIVVFVGFGHRSKEPSPVTQGDDTA